MLRAAAFGLLVAGSARADSSVPPGGEAAAKRRTWGEQCRARFERARAETMRLDAAFSTGTVERSSQADGAEVVRFELVRGKPTFAAWVVLLSPAERAEQAWLKLNTGWMGAQPKAEYRVDGRHSANVIDELPADAAYVAPLRALWRGAIDDCMQMDAPLPSAALPWGRASVKGAVADCVELK